MGWFFVGLVLGLVIGAAAVAATWYLTARTEQQQSGRMRDAFTAVSQQVIADGARQMVTLAEQVLKAQAAAGTAEVEGKKQLIDQSVATLGAGVERMRQVLQQVESERHKHYGELTERLTALSVTTESLRKALAGSRRVGEWGERMTEDVLRLAGMQEGVNFTKQSPEAAESGRPDFTFLLPNDLKVNMDVKFPMEKSLGYLDAADEEQRRAKGREFVSAVRNHLRAVAGRGYINPAGGTVEYVIVFIPNERVYASALELEPELMDEALKLRIVLCGPLTLYAMLAVVRQAAQNANIMRTADEVIGLLGTFSKQWQRFKESMDKMGKRLEDAMGEFRVLRETRTRMLEKPLEQIEDLRSARGLVLPEEAEPPADGRQE